MGKAVDSQRIELLVDSISQSILRNPGALISLARLKTADDYTYMHSVAVCALMIALGRQLDLDEALLRRVGVAGLLHDLGKAMIPMDIINKPGRLSDEEFQLIKTHPEEGYRLLANDSGVCELVLDVVLHHHEKMDGSGYPEGLKGDEISLYARMGAICDVYDAVTSNRPYKAGWDPAESLRKMAEWTGGHFDKRVFQAFVKSIGIYPVGSLVRLKSERLGIVIEQSSKSLLELRINVFFSIRSKSHTTPEIVDLSAPGCTERIIGREDPAKWGLDHLETLWLP
jgi:putative nucleotidyltransferase with HDIG domain